MKIVVDQTILGELLQRWHLDHAAEGLRRTVSKIVEQDHKDIGGTLRCFDLEPRRRRGLASVDLGDRRVGRLGEWQQVRSTGASCARTGWEIRATAETIRMENQGICFFGGHIVSPLIFSCQSIGIVTLNPEHCRFSNWPSPNSR